MMDLETNSILENLPMVALIGVIIVMYLPSIPSFIKLPVLIVGVVGSIGVSFVTEKVLQYEASSFPAWKCNIYPLNKTVTFFIKEQQGSITSSQIIEEESYRNFDNGDVLVTPALYRTGPLELATKVPFRVFGKVEKIMIEPRRPLDERVKTYPGVVIYKGVQIKHKSVALLTLFLDPNKGVQVDMLESIPTFKLDAAPQDYWILKNKVKDIGELDFE